MDKLNVQPSHCIAVEDSRIGVESATSAGIKTIQIVDRISPLDSPSELAWYKVKNFKEIKDIFDAL
mgnify:CR=1 FL=1